MLLRAVGGDEARPSFFLPKDRGRDVGKRKQERERRGKRVALFAAVLLTGIMGRDMVRSVYYFREILFFIGLVAIAVFFAVNVVVLGLIAHSAWGGLVEFHRKAKHPFPQSRPLIARGVYARENTFRV